MKRVFTFLAMTALAVFYAVGTSAQEKSAKTKTVIVSSVDTKARDQQTTIENQNVELAFKDVMLKQQEATTAITKLTEQYQSVLAPLQKKLEDAMTMAKKSQGIPNEYQYNVDNHKFEKPAPQKAPDGSPANTTKPLEKPEPKPESKP